MRNFILVLLAACSAGCSQPEGFEDTALTVGIDTIEVETDMPSEDTGADQINIDTAVTDTDTEEEQVLPLPWRPDEGVVLHCPWVSQEYSGDERDYTLNCGPTSVVMAAACMNGFTPVTQDIVDVIHWMDDNSESYGGSGENLHGSLTNGPMLEETMEGYYDISAQMFSKNSGPASLQDLYGDLQAGKPVIIATYGQGDNETDVMETGYGHFMLLVGMTPTHIIVNDPEPWNMQLGTEHEYTIDSFELAWQSNAGLRFTAEE